MALSMEKKKQIAAAVLGACALIAVSWSLFFSGDSGPSTPTQTKTNKPGIFQPVNPAGTGAAQPKPEILLVSQPLELGGLWDSTTPVMGRNIFVYPPPPPPPPTPTPPPPTPPPPPPPITLAGMNPSQVTARTTEFPLMVYGAKIPADARVMINGAQYPTTVTGDSQVKVQVPASVIANPGQVIVEVKGAADPAKMYSNKLTLNITPPPVPAYRYLGLIVKNGVSTAVLRDEAESELRNVRKGDKLGNRWQILNITTTDIEIVDLNINVKHRLQFSGDGG